MYDTIDSSREEAQGSGRNFSQTWIELERTKLFTPLLLTLVVLVAAFLLLKNIGNQYLWDDEAQTALIAETVLAHGVPQGYDGKNSFSQEQGAEFGHNYLYTWHPWIPFYILAGFFAVFGVNTAVARLPFALFGLGLVLLVYFLARSFRFERRVGLLAAVLLTTSIPFVVLSRQCRYYTPMAFFTLLGLMSYIRIVEGRKYARILFLLNSLFLFQVNQIFYGILLLTVLTHALVYHRDKFKSVLLVIIGSAVPVLAWLVWVGGVPVDNPHSARVFDAGFALRDCSRYIAQMGQYAATLPLLGAVPVLVWICRKKGWTMAALSADKNVALPLMFVGTSLLVLSLLMTDAYFRYLTPVVPVVCIFLAYYIVVWGRVHWLAGVVVLLLYVGSQRIPDYFYELTHDYDGPMEGISRYLNEHGNKNDVVAITYGDLPLKFYTDMRVVGGLTGEDLSPAERATWVIMRKYVVSNKDYAVRQYLVAHVPWQKYERVVLPYPDIPWENRETPQGHQFRTVTTKDPVVIFRRVRE